MGQYILCLSILIVPLSQVHSQTNKKVNSNIKIKGLGPKKIPIK